MRSGREAYGIGIAGLPDPWHGAFGGAGCSRNWHRETTRPKRKRLIGTRALTECGIARHPGPKIIESLTELASCAFFRRIGIAIKINSRNWHREGNCSRNLASWKAFAELASQ